MNTYRSKQTIEAVQFTGADLPGITCLGSSPDEAIRNKSRELNGCDSSRAHKIHVHTKDVGGMKVLVPGMWIFSEPAGPWATKSDVGFRAFWEVPEPVVAQAEVPRIEAAAPVAPVVAQVPAETVTISDSHTVSKEYAVTAEYVEHPAVDGPNPTETEADLHN